VSHLDPALPNVWSLHDWFEGLRAPALVKAVVERARALGLRIATMHELAEDVLLRGAFRGSTWNIERRAVPRGVGNVSVQGSEMSPTFDQQTR
jgi:hypothetical protein